MDTQVVGILRKSFREATAKPVSSSNLLQWHNLQHLPQSSTPAPVQRLGGGPATAATLLMRNAAASAASSVSSQQSPLPPPSQLPSGAAVIQKNPTHIAALQVRPDRHFLLLMCHRKPHVGLDFHF